MLDTARHIQNSPYFPVPVASCVPVISNIRVFYTISSGQKNVPYSFYSSLFTNVVVHDDGTASHASF